MSNEEIERRYVQLLMRMNEKSHWGGDLGMVNATTKDTFDWKNDFLQIEELDESETLNHL
ncbi:MAG: hypothetical protein V1487_03365 [bacterium]